MLLLLQKNPVNCLILLHPSQRNLVWLHKDLNGETGNLYLYYLCSFIVCACVFLPGLFSPAQFLQSF